MSRGRAPGDNHRWSDYRPEWWPDLPVVVLVSGGTTATFAQSLSGQISVFRDVLTAYALEIRRGRTVESDRFLVTPAMRSEVQRRLRDRGVAIADSVFGGATRIVDEQLGYEIARYTFGPAAERRAIRRYNGPSSWCAGRHLRRRCSA